MTPTGAILLRSPVTNMNVAPVMEERISCAVKEVSAGIGQRLNPLGTQACCRALREGEITVRR